MMARDGRGGRGWGVGKEVSTWNPGGRLWE